jgi:hypothetical protein
MAGFVDQYPNLPGHLTEFKDGGLQLTKEVNPPATDSILLLGTAVDGPIMEPVKVDSQTYETVFGKVVDEMGIPNGATLCQGFEEAYAAGCRDIRLMRVSGAVASYVLEGTATNKVDDKVFEGLLGAAFGNKAASSAFFLAEEAVAVTEVQANGVTLTADKYTVELSVEVADKFTDGTTVYDVADCDDIKIIQGTTDIVELATDDIYADDVTGDKVWGSTLGGVYTGKTIVLQAGVDYVKAGEVLAEDAFVDNAAVTIIDAKAVEGVVLDKVNRTRVTIKDDVCDNGSFVVIKYEDADGNVPVENASDISGTYKADGIEQEFVLQDTDGEFIVPVEGMTKLYFDGVEFTELDTVADSTDPVFTIVEFEEAGVAKAKVVMKPGKHAKKGAKIDTRLLFKKTTSYIPELKLETTFGGQVYNECQVQVDSVVHAGNFVEKIVKVIKPKAKRAQANEEPLTYSSIDYPTLALLTRAINNDPKNGGLVKAVVVKEMEQTPSTVLNAIPTAKNFAGGDDGLHLTNQELFEKLSGKKDPNGALLEVGCYQLLENYTVDMVVPCGINADDALVGRYDNFAYELALFCAVASHRNHTTIGAISTSSPSDAGLKTVEEHVKKLEALENFYFMRDVKGNVIKDAENNPIDLGRFIVVLAGGDMVLNNTRLGMYAVNSAAAFAGFVSTLPANSAPTNKVLKFAKGLKVKYSNAQLDRLTAKRFVTLKYKGNGSDVAVVDAMTCARPTSDYQRLSSMRAVKEIANEIREVADPFLGEPNTVQQRNALSALIDKRLGQHKEAGTVQDYSFQVVATTYDELIGQATIELTLVPAQELRRITTVISLKPTI